MWLDLVGTIDNYELFDFSKKKIVSQENKSVDVADEDEMFLLSLVSEMHKVPAEKKLNLRGDIISSIAAAQVQVLPQSQPR